jgi:hypothetical protein
MSNSRGITVFLASIAALFLSIYTIDTTYEFLDPAEKNYAKADKVICGISPEKMRKLLLIDKENEGIQFQWLRKKTGWWLVGRVFIVLFLWTIFISLLSLSAIAFTVVKILTRQASGAY